MAVLGRISKIFQVSSIQNRPIVWTAVLIGQKGEVKRIRYNYIRNNRVALLKAHSILVTENDKICH